MADYLSKSMVCPYYRRSDKNRICCEGTCHDNTINLVFGDSTKLRKYTREYCGSVSGYPSCLVCQMLDTLKYNMKRGT